MATYYYIRWFNRYGYNYKDTSMVPFRALVRFRRLARLLGETIEIEKMDL